MNLIKIILFDLDGTLTDSKQGIINSIRYTLAKMNLKENNINLERFIGPPLSESFEKYFGLDNKTARSAVSIYREYYAVKVFSKIRFIREFLSYYRD